MLFQRTVKCAVLGLGVGLHSGLPARFSILPAAAGSGISFVRTDLDPRVEIPAKAANVVSTRLATTLGVVDPSHGSVTIGTVEHLIAALYGLGVDNARVEVDGPEVPILDGCAQHFVERIREAGGTVAQRRPKRFLVVTKTVRIVDEQHQRSARLEPASSFRLACEIDFNHPLISEQKLELTLSDTTFVRELSRARTFGFGKDVDAMHAQGLAKGGSLDNAVVIDDFSIRNPEGLRYPDEFVRHKMLDAIGDLALVGMPLIGRYVGRRAGHQIHNELLTKLLADPKAYEVVECGTRAEAATKKLELPEFRLGGLALPI